MPFARVISTERAVVDGAPVLNVKCDMGGGDVVTAQHLADGGDDAVPMPDDFVALERSSGTGTWHVTGVYDPNNTGTADVGEKRIYARDANGAPISELHLKKDGTVSVKGLGTVACEMTFDPASGRATVTCATYVVEADSIRIGKGPGRDVACVGDLVACVSPPLANSGGPVVPTPPTAVSAAGGILIAGKIISGRTTVQAGP